MVMTQDQFNRIVAVITPHMVNTVNRQAIVLQALGAKAVQNMIAYNGSARAFSVMLVNQTRVYDGDDSGYPSLVSLLQVIRDDMSGASQQRKIDALIAELQGDAVPIDVASLKERSSSILPSMLADDSIERDSIFISYSHKDKEWHDRFRTAFEPLIRYKNLKVWSDVDIATGAKRQTEIKNGLNRTKIAFLLVTPNFLASDSINDQELPVLLDLAEKGEVTIYWVAVSASAYRFTPLTHYQCANNPSEPLNTLSYAEQDQTISDIASDIVQRMVIE